MPGNILTPRSLKLLLPLFISSVTFFLYFSALNNSFVNWDDNLGIVENTYIRHLDYNLVKWAFTDFSTQKEYWKPLVNLSHALDFSIWGLNPWGHHLVNILFHLINTVLVFFLSFALIGRGQDGKSDNEKGTLLAAAVCAALFGIHPMHAESVVWVTERKDVLSAFFFFLSLLGYLKYTRYRNSQRGLLFYSLSMICFLMAAMSKPMVVSLPLVLLILDYYPLKRFAFKKELKDLFSVVLEKIPYFMVSFALISITLLGQSTIGAIDYGQPFPARCLIALHALSFYIIKLLFPFNLAPFYPAFDSAYLKTPGFTLFIIPFLLVLLMIVFTNKKRFYITLLLYFLITLFPVLGVVKSGGQMAADRFTYIPSLAPFLLAGIGTSVWADKLQKKGVLFLYGLMILVVMTLFAAKLTMQIPVWKDSVSLWTHELKVYPYPRAHPVVHLNRGTALVKRGRPGEALSDLDKAISLARKSNEGIKSSFFVEAFYNRGTAKARLGLLNEALQDFNEVILLDRNFARAYNNRGQVYFLLRSYDKALSDYSRAIELDFTMGEAHYNRGLIYLKKGNQIKALESFTRAAKLGISQARRYLPVK